MNTPFQVNHQPYFILGGHVHNSSMVRRLEKRFGTLRTHLGQKIFCNGDEITGAMVPGQHLIAA
jgi:hypothetical protein